MAQHARPIGPVTNAAATFEPSMVQGARPDRSPERESWRQIQRRAGWHTAQTTHVQATFAPNMASDSRPQQNRQFLPPRSDYDFNPPEVQLFSVEMAQGSRPEKPRIFLAPRIPLPVAQPTHVQAPFGVDMVAGSKPDLPRLPFVAKAGWSVSQLTHVSAAVSADMVAGWHADRGVLGKPQPLPTVANMLTFDVFSVEMVIGSHPDSPRAWRYFPQGQQLSQPSHADAPFSPEMVTGEKPVQRPKQDLRLPIGLVSYTPEVFAFSVEMVQGSRPDSPRIVLGPRIPLPWSETSPVPAPFSAEMVQGHVPPSSRAWIAPRAICQVLPPDVLSIMIEMVQGSRPDSPRIFLAPRIPLPWSQSVESICPAAGGTVFTYIVIVND